MKTVGIIGGLGPETTSKFYLELSFGCQDKHYDTRPPILVSSVPVPYAVEEETVAQGKGEERYIPFLTDAAKRLENAGADFLVMPCNSLHAFLGDIRNAVNIPVLSIVKETTKFLKEERIQEVGMISTTITLNRKLYEDVFARSGIVQVQPNKSQQKSIDRIIYNLVSNKRRANDENVLMHVVEDFEAKGVQHVLLACTDLQLLIPEHPRVEILDTMKIFADATVREMLK